MDTINLSGKNYPIRFDFRALKEYKSISKNDVLLGFEQTTENIITLTFCALKSGHLFSSTTEFAMSEDGVSSVLSLPDMANVVKALIEQLGVSNLNDDKPKEVTVGEASGIV